MNRNLAFEQSALDKFFLVVLVIFFGVFCTACHATRLIRERGKPSSSSSISVGQRRGHSPAQKAHQQLGHPLARLRPRAVLVTKPGATVAGVERASTHATSVAAPYQGGPSLATTRVIRTTSISTTPASTVTTTSTPTTATASVTTSNGATTATSSTTSTTSSTTDTSTSTSPTSTSTAGVPCPCTYPAYHACNPLVMPCNNNCCSAGYTCQPTAGVLSCPPVAYCCL